MKIDDRDFPRLRCRESKNGTARYYYDHGGTPRRWEPLGKDQGRALAKYRRILDSLAVIPGSVDQMLAETLEAMRGRVTDGTLANYRGYRKHLAAVFDKGPEAITQADESRPSRTLRRMRIAIDCRLGRRSSARPETIGVSARKPCDVVPLRQQ